MTDKVASIRVRVTADKPNQLPTQFVAPAKKIEETLSGAIKTWIAKSGRDISGFGNRVKSTFATLRNIRFNKDGFISSLQAMEVKAIVVAKKIKGILREAYGGRDAQGRFAGGGVRGSAIAGGMLAAEYGKRAIDMSMGAGFVATDEANRVYEAANRISIGSRGAGNEYTDPTTLAKEFFDVAKNVKGVTAEAAADAASKFVSLTGDLKTARSSMQDFAVAATASGAEVGDVSEAVASVSSQFGVVDPKEVREVLAALIYQGKAGSFELKDAAALFQRLAASGAAFGIQKNAQGVKTLGGITQIARSGTGSGEQAATAVESLLTNLKVKSDDLKKEGVKVYDKGKIREIPDILVDAISKVGGSNTEQKNSKLAQIFGEQGVRAINPLIAKYTSTFNATQGTAAQKRQAGIEMLREQFNGAINAAGSWSDVMSDSERAQTTNTAKLTAAWQSVVSQVLDSVTPAFARLVDEFSNNPEAIRGFTDAIIFAGESLSTLADWVAMFTSGMSGEEYGKTKAAREMRNKEAKASRDLASLQMSPEEIAKMEKEDPNKLTSLRAQATLLRIQKEASGTTASQLEQEVLDSQAQHANGLLGKMASWFEAGPDNARTARKMGIDGIVQARIVNANDLKTPAGASPGGGAPVAPGYTRGG